MKHSHIIFTVRSARISWVKFKFEGYKHMGFKTRMAEMSTYVCLPLYEDFRSTYVSIIIDSVVGQENVYHSAGLQKYSDIIICVSFTNKGVHFIMPRSSKKKINFRNPASQYTFFSLSSNLCSLFYIIVSKVILLLFWHCYKKHYHPTDLPLKWRDDAPPVLN